MKAVSNRMLNDWLKLTMARGFDLKALLMDAGVPWERYKNANLCIDGIQLARLNAGIRRLLNDQSLGFGHQAMAPALLDQILIKILGQAGSLKEILSEWVGFWNLVQCTGLTGIECRRDEVIYRFQFNTPQRPGTYVWILDSTMLKLQLFSWMIGKQIKPNAIGVAEPMSAGAGDAVALLPAKVHFDQRQNFLVIDKSYLYYPVVRTPEECLNYKKYLPNDFFALPGEERRFAASVEKTMRTMLQAEFRLPAIHAVAEELFVSVRSLRRKLELEGESFQSLKDKVRRDFAQKKLACAEMPVGEIAADLGFSGTAAFSRAFRSWTASTPQEYRARYITL